MKNYRPDIDGLRAFAVLAVVFHHAFPQYVRGGFVGVDIFFVISGFLISSILFAEINENRFSLTGFYGRRVRRIFPALAVCLAAVLAFGFVCLMPFELAQLGKHVFFGASFLSNIVLWSESGYFDVAAKLKPLLHLWSLGIEEQFYILWPVILWAAFRIKARLGLLLSLLFLASFVINIALASNNISADFYLPFSRFWELLAGAALASRPPIDLNAKVRSWISVVGLAALLTSVMLFNPAMHFPGWPALLPVAAAMALIVAGPTATANRIILSNRAVIYVGLLSYPLYLWHWPLISYANIIEGKPPGRLLAAALVIFSFLLAWLTYRFVEYPIRFGAHRRRRTLIIAACVAALGGCGLAIWTASGFPGRFPGLDTARISEAKLDDTYRPTKDMDVLEYNSCKAGAGCSLGIRAGYALVSHLGHGERKVALAGDSLVFHYAPRVQQLSDEGRLAANTYFVTGPACAPVPDTTQRDGWVDCAKVTSRLFELVRREKVQSVVLGAAWVGYSGEGQLVERDGRRLVLDTTAGQNAFYANLEDYVRLLQNSGAKVYLITGSPSATRFDPAQMLRRSITGLRINPDYNKPEPVSGMRAKYAITDARLRGIAERTQANLLDPFSDVCENDEGCLPLFGAGEPKFIDGNHLRPAFVREHLHFLDFLLK